MLFPQIPGPAEGQLHWQCRDAQYNWIDPYTAAGSPVGTVCTQRSVTVIQLWLAAYK